MITMQVTNEEDFKDCVVGDTADGMLVAHIRNHFPHQLSVSLQKRCPMGQTCILQLLFYS